MNNRVNEKYFLLKKLKRALTTSIISDSFSWLRSAYKKRKSKLLFIVDIKLIYLMEQNKYQ